MCVAYFTYEYSRASLLVMMKETYIEKLKACQTKEDFARLLGYKDKTLSYILYGLEEGEKYFIFEIPKKNGEARTILAPNDKLKLLQKRLADYLYRCVAEIEKSKAEDAEVQQNNRSKKHSVKYSVAHAFKKNHSIISNASLHKNKKFVFNIDLYDFFPSIHLWQFC